MWARAAGLSDDELTSFSRDDFVQIRNGQASYGHVIFGKLRLPAVNDKLGEGFIHVRCGSSIRISTARSWGLRCIDS
jgi:hypothetical protein